MKLLRTIAELQTLSKVQYPTVLVPTMGALHSGHASLIDISKQIAGPKGLVIVSIFVNPTQFDRKEDLTSYPDTLSADLDLCEQHSADVVFAPSSDEIYFPNRSISITETSLSKTLCGLTRPGHFDGVGLVCTKLFNLTRATHAVFGEKDFQQLAIIRRLVRDLNIPIDIVSAATVREKSGLALSSRNLNLSPECKTHAPVVYAALKMAKQSALLGESCSAKLIQQVVCTLQSLPVETHIDYLEIVDTDTLSPLSNINDGKPLMAIAIFFDKVRLIDNISLRG